MPACCFHLFVNTIFILSYSFRLLPSHLIHTVTLLTLCVCVCVWERESECVYLECSSLVTVIVVVWVLLITGVNGWITARALCGCRVAGSSRKRQRAGKLFLPSGDGEKGKQKGERGNSGRQKGPIGGQSLRVLGSIWKATLCLALYCTPCCFNQWQACSQCLEQQWLFLIVSLLLPLFLLHYTPTLLTKSLKSCAALSTLFESRGSGCAARKTVCTMCEVKALIL